MDDKRITELFFERDENAIKQTQQKYGSLCRHIAVNILANEQDSEEAVSDAYISLWNSIPPERPESLKAYLARIVKNISLDRLRKKSADKRGKGQLDAALDELAELIPDNETPESELDKKLLAQSIAGFVEGLERDKRIIFIQRYWYLCSIKDIAKGLKMSEGSVKTALYRMRNQLKEQLEREGSL